MIFEGDYVKVHNFENEELGIATVRSSYGSFNLDFPDDAFQAQTIDIGEASASCYYMEVIGNIHEGEKE